MNNKIFRTFATVLALAAVLCAGLYFGIKQHTPYPLAGYSFETPQGEMLDLGALKGKIVILNFWGTWCPPCIEEIPELDALYTELQAENIQLLGIAIDSPTNVREFLQKTKVSYPILLAGLGGTELGKTLGNTQGGLPFTVILNAEGKQILTKAGKIKMKEITDTLKP